MQHSVVHYTSFHLVDAPFFDYLPVRLKKNAILSFDDFLTQASECHLMYEYFVDPILSSLGLFVWFMNCIVGVHSCGHRVRIT